MSVPSTPSHQAPVYAHVYRSTVGWRFLMAILGLVAIVPGLAGIVYFGTGHETPTLAARLTFSGMCLGFVLFGGYAMACGLLTRLTLDGNAIEYSGVFRSRRMPCNQISGRRILPTQYVRTLELVPSVPGMRKLKIPLMFETDPFFIAWLGTIHDLDASERARSEAEIAGAPEFGAAPDVRTRHLAVARKVAAALNLAVIAVAGWFWIHPVPFAPLAGTLVAMPLLAIALVAGTRGLFRLDVKRNDAHPALTQLIILPGLVLLGRAFFDVHFLSWQKAAAFSVAGGIGLAVLMAIADRSLRRQLKTLLVIFPFATIHVGGTLLLADVLLDRSQAQMFNVAVLGKHVSTGKTTTYYVKTGPWGASEAGDISVPRQVYDGLAENKFACIYEHAGAFDMPWFFAAVCPFDQRPNGNGNRPTPEIATLHQRAEAGDLKSIETLGLDYLNGNGVARDPVEAARWFRQAADRGSSAAEYNLGFIYQNGLGVERDYAQAVLWYRKAATDDPQAMVALGYLYSMGLGVAQDYAEARRYYMQAAEQGNALGAVNIAVMDSYGRAGPVDHVSAFHWYMVAAQQGQPVGMNGVGYSYLTGNGVEQDVAKGLAWLRAAADAGQPNAMQTLASELLSGTNLPRDPSEAYRWSSLAVRNYKPGDEKLPSAQALQARAASLLTADQRFALDAAVSLWRPVPGRPPS